MNSKSKNGLENKTKINPLKLISTYRQELMGFATLSVMYWHFVWATKEYTTASKAALNHISFYGTIFGTMGVEFFVFLSGLGLYFSMAKSSKLIPFYRKRFERIAVPYLFIAPPMLALVCYLRKQTVIRYFLEVTLIAFWTKHSRNLWYILFCIIVYLIFPIIFKVLQNKNGEKYAAALTLLLTIFILSLSQIFPKFYSDTEILLGRLPLFIIGAIYGKKIYNNQKMNKFDWCFALSGFIIKLIYMLSFYFKAYRLNPLGTKFFTVMRPFLRFITGWSTLSYILIIVLVIYLLRKTFLNKVFAWFGSMSLELYITHILMKDAFAKLGIAVWRIRYYALAMLISILISYVVHKATITVFNEMAERRKKKLQKSN